MTPFTQDNGMNILSENSKRRNSFGKTDENPQLNHQKSNHQDGDYGKKLESHENVDSLSNNLDEELGQFRETCNATQSTSNSNSIPEIQINKNAQESSRKQDSRIGACEIVQNEGRELFLKGDIEGAKKKYERLLQFVGFMFKAKNGEIHLGAPFRLIAFSNLALCELKLKQYGECIKHCNEVLALDPKSLKGHLRMAKAYQEIGQLDTARISYEKCLEIQPGLKDALIGLAQLEKEKNITRKTEEKLYKNWSKKTVLYEDRIDDEEKSPKRLVNRLGVNVWETLLWENWKFWIVVTAIVVGILSYIMLQR